MAAAWQASGALLQSGTSQVVPSNPAHQADDILIVQTTRQHLTQTVSVSGWTLLAGPVRGASLISTYWFWVRATSGAMTNPTCVWTGGNNTTFGIVHNVRGAFDPADPFSVVAARQDQVDPFIVSGITTLTAGELVCVVGATRDQPATGLTVTATDPAAFTQRDYQENSLGGNITTTFHDAIRTSPGSTGDITIDFNAAMPDDGHFLILSFKEQEAVSFVPQVMVF